MRACLWAVSFLFGVPALCAQTPNSTYELTLTPSSGNERWPQRTMRLVMSGDTISFPPLAEMPVYSNRSRAHFPANACFAVTVDDSAFRWAHPARWIPGRADSVRVQVFRSPDAQGEVRLAIDGDSVSGIELYSGLDAPTRPGPIATVRGRRVGEPHPQWCAQLQDAYMKTYEHASLVDRLMNAMLPPP